MIGSAHPPIDQEARGSLRSQEKATELDQRQKEDGGCEGAARRRGVNFPAAKTLRGPEDVAKAAAVREQGQLDKQRETGGQGKGGLRLFSQKT